MFKTVAAVILMSQTGHPAGHAPILKQKCAKLRAIVTVELDDAEKAALAKADGKPGDTWNILADCISRRGLWCQFQMIAMRAECQMWNRAALETDDKDFREFAITRIEDHQTQLQRLGKYMEKLKRIYERLAALKPEGV